MAGYGTDEKFNTWLAANGYTLPSGGLAPAILRQRGSNYIDSVYGPRSSGQPTGGVSQERQWPRTGAVYQFLNGATAIDPTVVPVPVEEASYFAAYADALSPGSLSVTVTPAQLVKRQKVEGAVEREFFQPGADMSAAQASTPINSTIEGMLKPFFAINTAADPFLLAIG